MLKVIKSAKNVPLVELYTTTALPSSGINAMIYTLLRNQSTPQDAI
jgi:hypothetical protein